MTEKTSENNLLVIKENMLYDIDFFKWLKWLKAPCPHSGKEGEVTPKPASRGRRSEQIHIHDCSLSLPGIWLTDGATYVYRKIYT